MTSAEFEYHGTDEDKEILKNKLKSKIAWKTNLKKNGDSGVTWAWAVF